MTAGHRHLPSAFHGEVHAAPFTSARLAGNRAGDPHVRPLYVYLPPGHDAPGARFPTVWMLAAFTSHASEFLSVHPWKPGVVRRFDRALARGEAPPAILVLPDGFTRLGGSQYVDSAYNGDYASWVATELVPHVDANYPTRPGRRALAGKSSGGFGALHLGMRHPDLFPVVASISGDVGFEAGLWPEVLGCVRGLAARGETPAEFLAALGPRPDLSGDGHAIVNALAMAAAYSPAPGTELGFELPADLTTAERDERVWQRWLAFDPLTDCEAHLDGLRALELLHLECGLRDEFHLQWGLRRLARRLDAAGVAHRHVEHEGGHFGLDARWDDLLPELIGALQ